MMMINDNGGGMKVMILEHLISDSTVVWTCNNVIQVWCLYYGTRHSADQD